MDNGKTNLNLPTQHLLNKYKFISLQETLVFFKNPSNMVFAPMSNLTKVPFWTSRFGPNHFEMVFLVGLFYWVFLIKFSGLNHHENNIIWVATINIYYLS